MHWCTVFLRQTRMHLPTLLIAIVLTTAAIVKAEPPMKPVYNTTTYRGSWWMAFAWRIVKRDRPTRR
jgi:hypothetical protein